MSEIWQPGMPIQGIPQQQVLTKEQVEKMQQQQTMFVIQKLAGECAISIVGTQYDNVKDDEKKLEEIMDFSYDFAIKFLGYLPSKYKEGNEAGD